MAGKSPVGSLSADLEEWLNPNSSVDIYVLGYVIPDYYLMVEEHQITKMVNVHFVVQVSGNCPIEYNVRNWNRGLHRCKKVEPADRENSQQRTWVCLVDTYSDSSDG